MMNQNVKSSRGILLVRSKSGTTKAEKVLVQTKAGKKKNLVQCRLKKIGKEKRISKIPVLKKRRLKTENSYSSQIKSTQIEKNSNKDFTKNEKNNKTAVDGSENSEYHSGNKLKKRRVKSLIPNNRNGKDIVPLNDGKSFIKQNEKFKATDMLLPNDAGFNKDNVKAKSDKNSKSSPPSNKSNKVISTKNREPFSKENKECQQKSLFPTDKSSKEQVNETKSSSRQNENCTCSSSKETLFILQLDREENSKFSLPRLGNYITQTKTIQHTYKNLDCAYKNVEKENTNNTGKEEHGKSIIASSVFKEKNVAPSSVNKTRKPENEKCFDPKNVVSDSNLSSETDFEYDPAFTSTIYDKQLETLDEIKLIDYQLQDFGDIEEQNRCVLTSNKYFHEEYRVDYRERINVNHWVMAQFESTLNTGSKIEEQDIDNDKEDNNNDDENSSQSETGRNYIYTGLRPLRSDQTKFYLDPSRYRSKITVAPNPTNNIEPLLKDIPLEIFEKPKQQKRKIVKQPTVFPQGDHSSSNENEDTTSSSSQLEEINSIIPLPLKKLQQIEAEDVKYTVKLDSLENKPKDDFCIHLKDPSILSSHSSDLSTIDKTFEEETKKKPKFYSFKNDFCVHTHKLPEAYENLYSSYSTENSDGSKEKNKIEKNYNVFPNETRLQQNTMLIKNVHNIETSKTPNCLTRKYPSLDSLPSKLLPKPSAKSTKRFSSKLQTKKEKSTNLSHLMQ